MKLLQNTRCGRMTSRTAKFMFVMILVVWAILMMLTSCKGMTRARATLVTIEHEGCEYVVAMADYANNSSPAIVHKANCKNHNSPSIVHEANGNICECINCPSKFGGDGVATMIITGDGSVDHPFQYHKK